MKNKKSNSNLFKLHDKIIYFIKSFFNYYYYLVPFCGNFYHGTIKKKYNCFMSNYWFFCHHKVLKNYFTY